uniref:Uncharacterized protein n=1 Tax=viral metagenome TaxID=1070528 RepID=A0A6C0ECW5_9ZZZZ
MNRYHGTANKQMMNNNLFNQYNKHINNNIPFQNNAMLMNNSMFFNNIRDPNFLNKINTARVQQIRKIKKIDDLGMTKEEMAKYVICPINIPRIKKEDFEKEIVVPWKDRENTFQATKEEYQKARTNVPYKDILKKHNEAWREKIYKDQKDLVIHKVVREIDKNELLLLEDYEKFKKMLEKHKKELKIIYSASEKVKHKREFEYIHKYKYRLKYDPKDYNQLKEIYKKEQKKIDKDKKRIDELSSLLCDKEVLSDDKIRELEKEIEELNKEEFNESTSSKKKQIQSIEKMLEEELGSDYEEKLKDLDMSDSDDDKTKKKKSKKTNNIKKKVFDESDKEQKKNNTKKKQERSDSDDSDDELNKFKNNKKSPKEDKKISSDDDSDDDLKKFNKKKNSPEIKEEKKIKVVKLKKRQM